MTDRQAPVTVGHVDGPNPIQRMIAEVTEHAGALTALQAQLTELRQAYAELDHRYQAIVEALVIIDARLGTVEAVLDSMLASS